MADMSFRHAGPARDALRAIVSEPGFGPEALSSPRIMSNLLKDYLPDAPRETSLLMAAAEAGLAESLSEHFAAGMEAASAIRLTASSLASGTVIEPRACEWVAREFAVALGLITADAAEALAARPTPIEPPLADQVPSSSPPAPDVVPQGSPPPGPASVRAWRAIAPTEVAVGGVTGGGPRRRRVRIAASAALAAAALVAAATAIAVSGALSPAPPVQPLSSIIAPFSGGCGPANQSFTLGGTTSSYLCRRTSATGVDLLAYQFGSSADYLAGLAALNTHTGFLPAGASRSCPPTGGSTVGRLPWHSTHSATYPARPGQILECYTDVHNHLPLLLWTLPGERAILLADDGAGGATLETLYSWWTTIGFD